MVSRQFRVLETVGSSPAASTKKTVLGRSFFILSKPSRTRTHLAHLHYVSTWFVTDICSHFASARIGFAFSAQSASSSLVSGKRENIHFW